MGVRRLLVVSGLLGASCAPRRAPEPAPVTPVVCPPTPVEVVDRILGTTPVAGYPVRFARLTEQEHARRTAISHNRSPGWTIHLDRFGFLAQASAPGVVSDEDLARFVHVHRDILGIPADEVADLSAMTAPLVQVSRGPGLAVTTIRGHRLPVAQPLDPPRWDGSRFAGLHYRVQIPARQAPTWPDQEPWSQPETWRCEVLTPEVITERRWIDVTPSEEVFEVRDALLFFAPVGDVAVEVVPDARGRGMPFPTVIDAVTGEDLGYARNQLDVTLQWWHALAEVAPPPSPSEPPAGLAPFREPFAAKTVAVVAFERFESVAPLVLDGEVVPFGSRLRWSASTCAGLHESDAPARIQCRPGDPGAEARRLSQCYRATRIAPSVNVGAALGDWDVAAASSADLAWWDVEVLGPVRHSVSEGCPPGIWGEEAECPVEVDVYRDQLVRLSGWYDGAVSVTLPLSPAPGEVLLVALDRWPAVFDHLPSGGTVAPTEARRLLAAFDPAELGPDVPPEVAAAAWMNEAGLAAGAGDEARLARAREELEELDLVPLDTSPPLGLRRMLETLRGLHLVDPCQSGD